MPNWVGPVLPSRNAYSHREKIPGTAYAATFHTAWTRALCRASASLDAIMVPTSRGPVEAVRSLAPETMRVRR